jgi:hypothetical protein
VRNGCWDEHRAGIGSRAASSTSTLIAAAQRWAAASKSCWLYLEVPLPPSRAECSSDVRPLVQPGPGSTQCHRHERDAGRVRRLHALRKDDLFLQHPRRHASFCGSADATANPDARQCSTRTAGRAADAQISSRRRMPQYAMLAIWPLAGGWSDSWVHVGGRSRWPPSPTRRRLDVPSS